MASFPAFGSIAGNLSGSPEIAYSLSPREMGCRVSPVPTPPYRGLRFARGGTPEDYASNASAPRYTSSLALVERPALPYVT